MLTVVKFVAVGLLGCLFMLLQLPERNQQKGVVVLNDSELVDVFGGAAPPYATNICKSYSLCNGKAVDCPKPRYVPETNSYYCPGNKVNYLAPQECAANTPAVSGPGCTLNGNTGRFICSQAWDCDLRGRGKNSFCVVGKRLRDTITRPYALATPPCAGTPFVPPKKGK